MQIFLLNLLIAIMNQTFSERYFVADLSKYKDQLQFVMDNFHLKDYMIKTHEINYIVAAFTADYHHQDREAESLKSKMQTLGAEFD